MSSETTEKERKTSSKSQYLLRSFSIFFFVPVKKQEAAQYDNWETGNIAALKTHPKQSSGT